MTEIIKQNIDNLQIQAIAQKIKEQFNPVKIILFGSHALGKPTIDSDLDLMVIMNTNLKPYKQASIIRIMLDYSLGISFPMDIMVRTPEEIESRLAEGDFFIQKILSEGIC